MNRRVDAATVLSMAGSFALVAAVQGSLVWLAVWLLDRDGVTDWGLGWGTAMRVSVIVHVVVVIALAIFRDDD